MRESDSAIDVPAPDPQASVDSVAAVSAVVTLALVAPFAVATYPVLLGAIAPLLGVALVR